MRNSIYIFLLVFGLTSCGDDTYVDNNFIPNIAFSVSVNLNLPESQPLLIPRQYVVYQNIGHRGVIVYNTGVEGVDKYLAFDLACPHVELSECSRPMDIDGFPELKNSCDTDGIFYSFELGYSSSYGKDEDGNQIALEGPIYDLQQYRAEKLNPSELVISNF